jgi:AraC family transcriptional regulator
VPSGLLWQKDNFKHPETMMEPKFVQLPEMKMVGLGTKFISAQSPDKNNMKKIPALWGQFMSQMSYITNQTGEASYGLVEGLPEGESKSHPDEMFYIACAEVTKVDSLPPGMIQRVVPAGKYASFTHKGKLDALDQTMIFIYRTWLPKSGVKLRKAPHLELYDQRFAPGSDKSEFDILLPIQ